MLAMTLTMKLASVLTLTVDVNVKVGYRVNIEVSIINIYELSHAIKRGTAEFSEPLT